MAMSKTEKGAVLRLLAIVNTAAARPQDLAIDDGLQEELRAARDATAELFADMLADIDEKHYEARGAVERAGELFVPEARRSFGPIFEDAGVFPEGYEEANPVVDLAAARQQRRETTVTFTAADAKHLRKAADTLRGGE